MSEFRYKFQPNSLKQLLFEQSPPSGGVAGAPAPGGIAGPTTPPPTPGGLTKGTDLNTLSSTLNTGLQAVKAVGSLAANPPSMVTSSALGLGGNLGFDAENQLDFMKHWKETIGSLGGDVAAKIPILGKYFDSATTNLSEIGAAMFFDPRARGRRVRIGPKPTNTSSSPQISSSVGLNKTP